MLDNFPTGRGADGTPWTPAGPVVEAYGLSRAPLAVCIGPTGGGKTTESIRRYVRIAQWQHPSPIDGIRKARILVVGTTYRRTWDQIIPSYLEEVPWATDKKLPGNRWTGARGDPADHHFWVGWQGFGRCYIEVLFRAVGDDNLEKFFQGFQYTAAHIPELTTWPSADILSKAANRIPRYPKPIDRPELAEGQAPAYGGVFADCNAPEIGTWGHERFYLRRQPSDAIFIQPPGYDPASPDGFHPMAENAANLRRLRPDYYKHLAALQEEWDVRRLLQNLPGYSRHGEPVHRLFDTETMVSRNVIPVDPDARVVIGVDAGSNTLRPAAAFMQRSYGGQVRVLAEVVPRQQMDLRQLCDETRRIRETKFAAIPDDRIEIVVDPAARGQSATRKGVSWAQMISQMTGIGIRLAPSQDPRIRIGALNALLKPVGPGEPGFVVSGPDCPGSVEALAGGYRFKRSTKGLSAGPDKSTWHADIADALQYGASGIAGTGAVGSNNPADLFGGQDAGSMSCILPD